MPCSRASAERYSLAGRIAGRPSAGLGDFAFSASSGEVMVTSELSRAADACATL